MSNSLQRTNPRLTGNIKVVVKKSDTVQSYFLESINSSPELSRFVYKGFNYSIENSFKSNVRTFSRQFTNVDALYDVINEQQIDISNNLKDQYHRQYDFGCYSSSEKIVRSKQRFFAPLMFNKSDIDNGTLPEAFVIYRIPLTDTSTDTDLNVSFNDTVKNGTLVNTFDLNDILGSVGNDFSDSNIDVLYDSGFTVTGIDPITGMFVNKTESNIDSILANERTITEFENFVTNSYQRNRLIYSNIVNFEFAFDDASSGNFERYVGFYVNYNEVDKTVIDASEFTLKLLRTETDIIKYNDSRILETYKQVDSSSTGLNFGQDRAPQVQIKVNFSPKVGDRLTLTYQNNVDVNIPITPRLIGRTKIESKNLIVSELNSIAETVSNINIEALSISDTEFIIRSTVNNTVFESITVGLPSTFSIDTVLFSQDTYNNSFYGGSRSTLVSSTLIDASLINTLRIKEDNGAARDYIINRVTRTELATYLYRLTSTIENKTAAPGTIWFVRTLTEQPIVCSVLNHMIMDFDRADTSYEDVLDFSPERYRQFLLSEINDPSYRGRADDIYDDVHPGQQATDAEVAIYRDTVTSVVNSYFDDIVLERSYLIKDVDLTTLESTQISNEYSRLNELNLPQLANMDKLYAFINKWSLNQGTDIYYNPYRLNTSLAFGFINFSPSTVSVGRDIRYHTHSWLILGEGQNPYYPVNEQFINKHLSYSREPINEELLLSTTTDAYSLLEYNTNVRQYQSYELLKYDAVIDRTVAFYKGLRLEFNDASLDSYKFAAVLQTRNPTPDDFPITRLIRNDQFKTITLFINFYVPDPILTSLERGSDSYFLDRSLLYFSNEIYSTNVDTVDFGTTDISVGLYDDISEKTYLGRIVTNNWYFTDDDNQNFVYVSRGDAARFRTLFPDVLVIDQDFTIYVGDVTDSTDPLYGLEITFIAVQEVQDTYFWCREIQIRYVDTTDPGTPTDPTDNTVVNFITINILEEFLANPNLFYENNIAHISGPMAYENAVYDKIVRARANVARYQNISVAAISEVLNSTELSTKRLQSDDTVIEEFQTCRIDESTDANIAIKLSTDSAGNLINVDNQYVFPIKRYDGTYTPVVKDLVTFNQLAGIGNSVFNQIQTEERYRLNVTTDMIDTVSNSEQYSEQYLRRIIDRNFYTVLMSVDDTNVFNNVPWVASPQEYRSYVSFVMNSEDTLLLPVVSAGTDINILEQLSIFIRKYCNFEALSLSNEDRVAILSLYTDVTLQTLQNFDFEQYIIRQFIRTTLFSIYEITNVYDENNQRVQFTNNGTVIHTLNSSSNRFTIELTR